MRSQLSFFCLVLMLNTALFSASEANAGLILEGFGDQTWDRLANPGISPYYTLTISPDGTLEPSSLWAFSVALAIVPTANATGTLSVGDRSVPDTDPLFDGNYELPFAPIYELGGASVIPVEYAEFPVNWLVPDTRNAVDIAFTSQDAQGVFEIWARPDFGDIGITYYFSGWDDYHFTNIPSGGGDVLLGTLNVSAIPEPSSLTAWALLGSGLVGFAKIRRRRRR